MVQRAHNAPPVQGSWVIPFHLRMFKYHMNSTTGDSLKKIPPPPK